MIQRRPESTRTYTLCPYTTLCRSQRLAAGGVHAHGVAGGKADADTLREGCQRGEAPRVIAPVERAGAEENIVGEGAREGAQRRLDVAPVLLLGGKPHADLAFALRDDLVESEAAVALRCAALAQREQAAERSDEHTSEISD